MQGSSKCTLCDKCSDPVDNLHWGMVHDAEEMIWVEDDFASAQVTLKNALPLILFKDEADPNTIAYLLQVLVETLDLETNPLAMEAILVANATMSIHLDEIPGQHAYDRIRMLQAHYEETGQLAKMKMCDRLVDTLINVKDV